MPENTSTPLHPKSPLVEAVLEAQAATQAAAQSLAMMQEHCAQAAKTAAQGPEIETRLKAIATQRQDILAAIAVGESKSESLTEFDANHRTESDELEQRRVAVNEAMDLQAGLERKIAAKETEVAELRRAQAADVQQLLYQAVEHEAGEYIQATQRLAASYRRLQGLILNHQHAAGASSRISLVRGMPEAFIALGVRAFQNANLHPHNDNKLFIEWEGQGSYERWRTPVAQQLAQLGVKMDTIA